MSGGTLFPGGQPCLRHRYNCIVYFEDRAGKAYIYYMFAYLDRDILFEYNSQFLWHAEVFSLHLFGTCLNIVFVLAVFGSPQPSVELLNIIINKISINK